MENIKIVVIGAGSAVFSLNLIRDICLTPSLRGATISLVDINKERLNAIYALFRRYSDELNVQLNIEKTTNRREVLKDADFVINTALATGHPRLREGWSIAEKYGYRFGGSLHIMHDEAFWINFYQFRLFEEIIEDILDLCPNAWYIQLANPVLAGITYLGRKYPEAKIVGLCHGFRGVYHVANVLGLDVKDISFEAPGVNHFIWLTHFYYRGEDAYPLLDEWIEGHATEYWRRCSFSDAMGPKAIDLYKRFGLLPIGDTCTPGGGSWPFWYHVSKDVEEQWREDPKSWWKNYFSGLEQRVNKIFEVALNPNVKVTTVFPPKKSGEIIVPLIESLAFDVPRVLQVNILNTGSYVPGIPQDFEVEVPALVSKRGIQGIRTTGLPKRILSYLLRDRIAPVEIELEAYERGDKDMLHQLIMMDPWTKSEEQAKKLLDDILSLPYNEGMRRHYK